MTVNDVPFNPPRPDGEDGPARRVTLHHIDDPELGPMLSTYAQNNFDARLPQDTTHWPPAIILDHVYAAAVIQAWGPKEFSDSVWK